MNMTPENLYTPNCIRTVSGRYINVLDPDPDTIRIEDIAFALCKVQRFGGHLPVDYSVARHSIEVCGLVTLEHRFQALMHDASDAVFGDMPTPIKNLCPDFKKLETKFMHVLAKKFGFDWPEHESVRIADKYALENEWQHIMLGKSPDIGANANTQLIYSDFIRLFNLYQPQ